MTQHLKKTRPSNNQSLIFFSNKNQLTLAKQKKNELNFLKDKMITKITPVSEYHNGLEEIKIS